MLLLRRRICRRCRLLRHDKRRRRKKPGLRGVGGEHRFPSMNDLIFEVTQESDGGFVAECLTEPIVTQGDTWPELSEAVNEVVKGYFFDEPHSQPERVRLHLVRDESFALA